MNLFEYYVFNVQFQINKFQTNKYSIYVIYSENDFDELDKLDKLFLNLENSISQT